MGFEGGSKRADPGLERASESTRVEIVVGGEIKFPIFTTLGGIAVVVIEAGNYRKLLAAAFPAVKIRGPAPRRLRSLPSTIERDPEVAAFLREWFGRAATVHTARAACLERFGAERTPSRTRIGRFRAISRERP